MQITRRDGVVFLASLVAIAAFRAMLSSPAAAYPAGNSVSYGANPIVSSGGSLLLNGSATVLAAPEGQDIVVTDVVIAVAVKVGASATCGYTPTSLATLSSPSQGTLAALTVPGTGSADFRLGPTDVHLLSGLRLPAGESLTLKSSGDAPTNGYCTAGDILVHYTLSGYYSEP